MYPLLISNIFHKFLSSYACTNMSKAFWHVWLNTKPLNAKLHPICHLPTLVAAHHILHVSRIRVTLIQTPHSLLVDRNKRNPRYFILYNRKNYNKHRTREKLEHATLVPWASHSPSVFLIICFQRTEYVKVECGLSTSDLISGRLCHGTSYVHCAWTGAVQSQATCFAVHTVAETQVTTKGELCRNINLLSVR